MTEESDIFTQIRFEHLLCGSIRIAWLGFNKFIFIYYVLYDNFILNLSNKQIYLKIIFLAWLGPKHYMGILYFLVSPNKTYS